MTADDSGNTNPVKVTLPCEGSIRRQYHVVHTMVLFCVRSRIRASLRSAGHIVAARLDARDHGDRTGSMILLRKALHFAALCSPHNKKAVVLRDGTLVQFDLRVLVCKLRINECVILYPY